MGWTVDILSVFNDKILVGRSCLSQLFIYSREGRHLSTITICDNDICVMKEAIWTPRGSIAYTVSNYDNSVVVISESCKIIAKCTQIKFAKSLSVSNDIIYLADFRGTVFQSTDDGVSWSMVFKSTNIRRLIQVIKVTTDYSDDFWTLDYNSNYNVRLRVYSVDRRRLNNNVTQRDVNLSTTDAKHINLSSHSTLLYDGKMNIFLSDRDNKAVHVLSVNGQYHCQLLSSYNIESIPYRLAVDKERQLLYVGQYEGVVEVFELKYGNEE